MDPRNVQYPVKFLSNLSKKSLKIQVSRIPSAAKKVDNNDGHEDEDDGFDASCSSRSWYLTSAPDLQIWSCSIHMWDWNTGF